MWMPIQCGKIGIECLVKGPIVEGNLALVIFVMGTIGRGNHWQREPLFYGMSQEFFPVFDRGSQWHSQGTIGWQAFPGNLGRGSNWNDLLFPALGWGTVGRGIHLHRERKPLAEGAIVSIFDRGNHLLKFSRTNYYFCGLDRMGWTKGKLGRFDYIVCEKKWIRFLQDYIGTVSIVVNVQ